ncbi:MAG: lipid A deacylase LpxR family protein [Candidatus Saccharicenans sp.]|nr:lipid A deacylase LpxR family protein [Candidatus Saccharicenans sp.]
MCPFLGKTSKCAVARVAGACLLLLSFGLSFELQAQFRPPARDRGSFVFSLENDVLLKQDEGYTNGVQFMWITPELSQNSESSFLKWLAGLNRRLLGGAQNGPGDKGQLRLTQRRASLSLVQGMFTPDNLSEKELIPDDRPYAGLLYVSLGLVKLGQLRQDSVGLAVGVVGPLSLAGTIQRWLHRTYGWTYPEGWENQLKNEPVVELWFNRLWTLVPPRISFHGLQPVVKAGAGAQVGNLLIASSVVADLKLGFNLEPQMDTFTAAPLFNHFFAGRATRTSVYAFVRLEGRAVARNLLLQGNTFQESHGVDIHRLYGQLSTGLAYQSRQAGLLLYFVMRTREFVGQKYREPYFGLTFSFNL